ncbi:MAG TPA: D-inositol-3-phosphate glycosyltransferase [Propionibacteriaceae bacterium]|nr:D-inositol-3-phosphate glycosyltransferase [Propionibacteriaceae bacterium]
MVSLHTSPLDVPGVGDAGGLNVYVTEVAHRLAERGLEVDVFTRHVDPALPSVVEMGERIRTVHLPAGPVGPVAKEELPELIGPFATALGHVAGDYDLLHSHYWLSGLAALEVARRHRLPLVHTMHTMALVKNAARGEHHLLEPEIRVRGESAIVAAADMLTANTTDEAAELVNLYGARGDQIVTVPPGVDLHTFHPCDRPKSRAQLGVDQDAEVILFVGRIQPLKAPDVLVRAAARLVERHPDRRKRLVLVLVGSPSGPETGWVLELRRLAAALGLDDVVEFRPHSPRAELFRWYCVCDVVGVPSYNESFGLVALEAQACGRPVVATDVGGLRHAVDDQQTGVLVKGHDPDRWADALAGILDDPSEAARLGGNGAVHASRFSWDNSTAATLKAYALASRPRQD